MKKGSKLLLGVCLAIGLAIAFTGCASTNSGSQSTAKNAAPTVLVYDSNLDGTWKSTRIKDEDIRFVFYKNTWRLIIDGKVEEKGIFFQRPQGDIFCTFKMRDTGFPLGYKVTGNTVNLKSKDNPMLAGDWEKIDSGRLFSETNPLVGNWRNVDEKSTTIYQIFADGTGIGYNCTHDFLFVDSTDEITYDAAKIANTGKFSNHITGAPINGVGYEIKLTPTYELNGDELSISGVIYKRE